MEHKNQHFIPKSYLSAWCDPNTPPQQTPYVWIFTKDGKQSDNKAPHNILYETDTYTIKSADGSRDLKLERGLCELESRFVHVRDKKICKEKPLGQEEHFYLCAFMAAMLARTKAQREHHKEQWGGLLKDLDEMIKARRNENPNARIMETMEALSGKGRNGATAEIIPTDTRMPISPPVREITVDSTTN